jgi:uncharacterized membrane protein YbhN (UPF0104 family)
MRDFRRLPSHLRVVSLLGLLCLLASSLLFSHLFATFLSSLSGDSWRVLLMAVNLLIFGWTSLTVARNYRARIPQSDGGPFPLSSWQHQVWAIVLWTALPVCALALATFIPPTAAAFGIIFPATMLAMGVLVAAHSVARESNRSMHSPDA